MKWKIIIKWLILLNSCIYLFIILKLLCIEYIDRRIIFKIYVYFFYIKIVLNCLLVLFIYKY